MVSQAPSWAILPPSSKVLAAILSFPRLSKIGQDSIQENFHAKIASKTSQTPSRLRFFKFSGPFFKGFRQFFRIPFYRFRFKVYSFLDTFSLIFFGRVPLERSRRERGRRYSPAGRLRYVLYCYIYIYKYIYMV